MFGTHSLELVHVGELQKNLGNQADLAHEWVGDCWHVRFKKLWSKWGNERARMNGDFGQEVFGNSTLELDGYKIFDPSVRDWPRILGGETT